MNRYDYHFRSLPAAIRVNTAQKVGFARAGLIQRRRDGFGPEGDDAVVRQFDLSGMAEFWDVVLSEPMGCDEFAHALAVHFMVIEHKPGGTEEDRLASGLAASRAAESVRAQLRSALRRARLDGEPWFIELPSQDKPTDPAPTYRKVLIYSAVIGPPKQDYALVVPDDPPADGIDLLKLKVRPRQAVEWLLAMPKRSHLVPPSLVAALRPPASALVKAEPAKPIQTKLPVRRRGPKPTKIAAVATAIKTALSSGKHTLQTLDRATEESLVAEFGTSRETCRKARDLVLSEFVGDTHPGK